MYNRDPIDTATLDKTQSSGDPKLQLFSDHTMAAAKYLVASGRCLPSDPASINALATTAGFKYN